MVTLINTISSTIAVLLIISGIKKLPGAFYISFFIVVGTIDWLSLGSVYTLPLRIIGGMAVLIFYIKDMVYSLFLVLTAESLISCFVFLLAPLLSIISITNNSIIFNMGMSILVILVSGYFKILFEEFKKHIKLLPKRAILFFIFCEAISIIPISIFSNRISQNYLFLFTSFLLLYSVIVLSLICWILRLLLKEKTQDFEKSIELQKKLITWNIGKNSHFTIPAISLMRKYIDNNDINGIRSLYEKYIGPTHRNNHIEGEIDKLKQIKMPLIYDYLYDLIIRKDNINLIINGPIEIITVPEVDLFIILAQYIQNAIEHLGTHKEGEITIYLSQSSEGDAYIEITNTYYGDKFEIVHILNSPSNEDHMGFGLKYIKEIIDKNNLINNTYIKGNRFIQSIEIEV